MTSARYRVRVNLRTTVETTLARTLMGLPERAQRVLAGPPVVVDGQTLATDLQLMLRLQRLAGKDRLGHADVAAGRAALLDGARVVGGNQPIGATRDLDVAGLRARHYLPRARVVTGAAHPGPLVLFFHGGGFLYGDLESHDAPCRVLAEESGVPVLAIDWGLGPEQPFPRGFDDAEAALRWVVEHAAELDVDPDRIAVAGDSAGGNLAAWTAIVAARAGIPLALQVLFYPCTDADRSTRSLELFGEGFYLTADAIAMFNDAYLLTAEGQRDERMNLLDVELPAGVAPAIVVTAGFDPLRDEGEAYAQRLAETGAQVHMERYADQIHGFLNMVGAGRSSRLAVDQIADRVRLALRSPGQV